MKLLNHSLLYLSLPLLIVIGIWAGIFYLNMIDEVHDSIDDGLENYKMLIIRKAAQDSALLQKSGFDEGNYAITAVPEQVALSAKEHYADTMMYMQAEDDKEPVRLLTTYFKSGSNYYQLRVISSMVEEDDLKEALLYALLWLYIGIIASLLIINNVLLKRIWKPFYVLIEQIKKFRLKHEKAFVPPATRVAEFKDLNKSIALLLENNISTYNSQKQFIENAAHELQTPLAISINKLELLIEQQTADNEQSQALGQVIHNLERLTRLNKALLLLTKIENGQFPDEAMLNFNTMFRQQLEGFSELIDYKALDISLTEKGTFQMPFHKDLAAILVSNTINNAILHNYEKGSINIIVQEAGFSVANTGAPQALDKEKLFTRFYKNGASKNSTGLGLAIIKAIADLYQLKTKYTFDGQHTFEFSR